MIEQYINKITCADCLDILKQLPDKCVDLVCTDCPYRIGPGGATTGADGNLREDSPRGVLFRGYGKAIKPKITESDENSENVKSGKMFEHNEIKFEDWLPEIYRVLKDKTHCYIMVNGRNLAELQKQAEKVGFIYQNLLVWDKGNVTPNKFYLNACEFILMLRKNGERWINNMGSKTILKVPNIIGDKCHPTEKPVQLMEILIANSTNENDIVLDLFCGAGSTCIATKNLNRRFIGIEIDEQYAKIAQERLEQEQKQIIMEF